jgi:DNA-binding MarR family transcriptional regulator
MKENNSIPLGRLMANVCRLQATRMDQLMERIGLYRGQALLLHLLSERDGLTHSEVAEKLCVSPSAATKVIRRLEELRYLQRQADPADARIWRVYLKDEGRAVIDQIHAAFHQIHLVMLSDISPDEQDQLRDILGRIQANLERLDENLEIESKTNPQA